MSCDSWTYDTYGVRVELDDDSAAPEAETHPGKCLKQGRGGASADQSKAKGHRHDARSRIIPDSTQTEPEYVWGDEGPIND